MFGNLRILDITSSTLSAMKELPDLNPRLLQFIPSPCFFSDVRTSLYE